MACGRCLEQGQRNAPGKDLEPSSRRSAGPEEVEPRFWIPAFAGSRIYDFAFFRNTICPTIAVSRISTFVTMKTQLCSSQL